jgi:hypothetical protein
MKVTLHSGEGGLDDGDGDGERVGGEGKVFGCCRGWF